MKPKQAKTTPVGDTRDHQCSKLLADAREAKQAAQMVGELRHSESLKSALGEYTEKLKAHAQQLSEATEGEAPKSIWEQAKMLSELATDDINEARARVASASGGTAVKHTTAFDFVLESK